MINLDDLRQKTQEFDDLKVKIAKGNTALSKYRKRCKELDPFVQQLLYHVNGNLAFTKVGKSGAEVSAPLLLRSQNVAQLNVRTKRLGLTIDTFSDAIHVWLLKHAPIGKETLSAFLQFLDKYRDDQGVKVTSLAYRKAKKSEHAKPDSDKQAPQKKQKVVQLGADDISDSESGDDDDLDEDITEHVVI